MLYNTYVILFYLYAESITTVTGVVKDTTGTQLVYNIPSTTLPASTWTLVECSYVCQTTETTPPTINIYLNTESVDVNIGYIKLYDTTPTSGTVPSPSTVTIVPSGGTTSGGTTSGGTTSGGTTSGGTTSGGTTSGGTTSGGTTSGGTTSGGAYGATNQILQSVNDYPFVSQTCFLKGTPINTDQGVVAIEKINPNVHQILGKPIVGITKTITQDKYVICFQPNSIAPKVPSVKTIISKNHIIYHKGEAHPAEWFTHKFSNVYKIKYSGEHLYNVLMDTHEKMLVNNMVCETLHPENSLAKIYRHIQAMSPEEQERIIKHCNQKTLREYNRSYRPAMRQIIN